MKSLANTQRVWALTIQRFAEVAYTRHGATRYASVVMVPIVVAIAVPGWWWALIAAGTATAIFLDQRLQRQFYWTEISFENCSEADIQRVLARQATMMGALTALYVLPYGVLAFAPTPGPALGLMFCAGSALVAATLHVMTRSMILYTIPSVALGLAANGAALAHGWLSWLIGGLGAMLAVNAVVAARAGATSFGDLISARLKAEGAAEDLERRVTERTAALAEATERAESANRAKSVFLANMSHELRTPLNAVIGYSEIVLEDLASGDTQTSTADMERIRAAATHLLGLINEVLDLSRVEAGKIELTPSHVDLRALMTKALETIGPQATKNNTVCDLVVEPGVDALFADELRLRQCALNLLSNAAKFTRNGRVTALVRRAEGAAYAIEVHDTGPGIAPDDLARLFQPFVQAQEGAARPHDGAGLGLVITRRLARLMGGDVRVESVVGRGSVFTLVVPVEPPSEDDAARQAA